MTTRLRAYAALWLVFALTVAGLAGITRAGATGPETPSSYTIGQTIKAKADTVKDYGSGVWGGPVSGVVRVGDPATTDVLMVGDSIVNGCRADLIAAFAAKGKTLSVIAQSGQNAAGLYLLLSALDNTPPDVVFAGGTNDVTNPFGVRPTVADVKLWAQSTGKRVFLVDTYVGRPNTLMHDLRNSGQVNGYLYASGLPVISPVEALTAAVGRAIGMIPYYVKDGVHYWPEAGTGHGDGCAFYAYTVASGWVAKR